MFFIKLFLYNFKENRKREFNFDCLCATFVLYRMSHFHKKISYILTVFGLHFAFVGSERTTTEIFIHISVEEFFMKIPIFYIKSADNIDFLKITIF